MRTHHTLAIGTCLLAIAIALVAACADGSKKVTTLPTQTDPSRTNETRRAVALFRIAVDEDGQSVPGIPSTAPRWKWHYRVNIGGADKPLDSDTAFAAGQIDAATGTAGWGFVTVPPGTYQLAFAAFRTRFAMPGARRESLGYGQSSAARVDVPADADLLYIGTFAFQCHKADRWWGYTEHECTHLLVSNEEELARDVASTHLNHVGPLRTVLASTAPVDPSQ
jgi:hypothetical protein